MKYPDFAKCQERSIILADSFARQNVDVRIPFGIYKPVTPRESWDDRWQLSVSDEFIHFWLEVGKYYFDCSLLQFGEKSFIWSFKTDKRYTLLGYFDYIKQEIVDECGPYKIVWDSIRNDVNGIPSLTLYET